MRIRRTLANALRSFIQAERVALTPFVKDLKTYDLLKFRHDSWAAANVTVLALAQSLAFAAIAGLPVVYGIISTAVAALVAPLFAGSRQTILGPTNATAFMLFSFFSVNPALAGREGDLVPLLVLMVGLMAMVGAFFKVADLLQYISRSVLVGYISGAAVLIVANQLKPFLGLDDYIGGQEASTFVGLLMCLVREIHHTHWVSLLIGGTTLVIFFGFKRWCPKCPAFAVALVLSSMIFGSMIHSGIGPFADAETFKTFTYEDLMFKMPNLIRGDIFADLSALVSIAFAIAFLASLENSLMAKTLASKTGDRADVNQDMLAVGMANLAAAFAGGMPASGSLTRSVLNHASGARTRFASFFSGACTTAAAFLIAASVGWGVPLIDYVPRAALAALVIVLSLSLFNAKHLRICLRSTGGDAAVLLITFISTLLVPLHEAIFIGVGISITLFLRKASRPFLIEYEFSEAGELREMGEKRHRPIPAISIVHVEGDLFFGAAELFRTQIQRTVMDPAIQVIILRLKNARHLDATSVMALEDLIHFMRERGLHLLISGATKDVYRVLKKSGILLTLQEGCDRRAGESNLFLTNPRNPNLSTRSALKRAQQLLGTEKADIRIFYDPQREQKSL
jgi:SulP family sulfate permease